jgi:protein-disulfide isomerase
VSRQPEPPLTRRERRQQARHERPIRDRSRTSPRRAPRRPAWQSPVVLVSALALVVAVGLIVLNQKPEPTFLGGELIAPPISYSDGQQQGESLGAAEAPVVLTVYSDFQCPVCARFVKEDFQTLKTRFVDTGVLRIEAQDIAILGTGEPNESIELAAAAMCAGDQGRYWTFHDLIFWNQGRENQGDHDASYLAAVADRSGLDRSEWDACMAGDEKRDAVRSQTAIALGRGINATPTIALNDGQPTAGLPVLDGLVAQIELLAAAAGVTPSPTSSTAP